jgi:hypothetical protein
MLTESMADRDGWKALDSPMVLFGRFSADLDLPSGFEAICRSW